MAIENGYETLYYLYNGHSDVTALLNANDGTVEGTYYYDAFGNILEHTGTESNVTYSEYQYDQETGLYYLNARMYDPTTARFLQEDTYGGEINDPLSLNRYAYCHNEPLMYYDSTGHETLAEHYRALDFGLIPVIGSVADAINGGIYALRGKKTE